MGVGGGGDAFNGAVQRQTEELHIYIYVCKSICKRRASSIYSSEGVTDDVRIICGDAVFIAIVLMVFYFLHIFVLVMLASGDADMSYSFLFFL